METKNPLAALLNEDLSAVCFVMDYVEFHFNGPVLRSISNPVLEQRGVTFEFPMLGAREALCTMVGKTVKQIEEAKDEAIKITFSTGEVLKIPLDLEHRFSGEAAHFMPTGRDEILVW